MFDVRVVVLWCCGVHFRIWVSCVCVCVCVCVGGGGVRARMSVSVSVRVVAIVSFRVSFGVGG